MTSNAKPAPTLISQLEFKYSKEIKEILNWNNQFSEYMRVAISDCNSIYSVSRNLKVCKLEEYIMFFIQYKQKMFLLLEAQRHKIISQFRSCNSAFAIVSIELLELKFDNFIFSKSRSEDSKSLETAVQSAIEIRNKYSNYQSNKDKFAQIKEKYEQWKNDNKNISIYIFSVSDEDLLKPPEEYELLLKKVELQLEKVPKILEQQKQLEFDSDLYKLADEILSGGIRDADYETYKNKVEEFEREFEKFDKNKDLKNDNNQPDNGKESDENKIGNDNDGGTLENENVLEEKSDDSNSECSNGGACSCLKNILWYRVFLYLSLFSLLLLIISVYCLIVTAIFLLASVVLYFIQKTKKDNDNMEVMADNLLSSEINQEQSKNLISIDKDHSNNVKQQNEFSLFERANDGINKKRLIFCISRFFIYS